MLPKPPLQFAITPIKFLPLIGSLPYRSLTKEAAPADDVIPPGTCIYFLTNLPQLCGSTTCSGTNSFCSARGDIVSRNKPEPFSQGGSIRDVSVPCNRPQSSTTCTCPQSTRLVKRWSPTLSCQHNSCPVCPNPDDEPDLNCLCPSSGTGGCTPAPTGRLPIA